MLVELVDPGSLYVHSNACDLPSLVYDPSVEDAHLYCPQEAVVRPSSLRELACEHLCGLPLKSRRIIGDRRTLLRHCNGDCCRFCTCLMIGGHSARTEWGGQCFVRCELGGECCVCALDERCCQACYPMVDIFPGDNRVIPLMLSTVERCSILCQHRGQAARLVNVTHRDIA